MKSFLVRTLLTLAILCGGAARLPAEENTLSPSEERAGWKLLFDGQSTKGWHNYKRDKVGDGWVVEGGILRRAKAGAGDIVSDDEFENFELSLEYRIAPAGNSGIIFHATEDEDAPWKTGPEVQILDNVKGRDPQKSGWLYQLYQPYDPMTKKTIDATRPAGEWNQVQLLVAPNQSEVNVNGWRYYQFQKGSDDWKARVAKSKFAAFPNFGKPTRGHIALQDHGDEVAFRNIKLRELKADGSVPDPVDGQLDVKIETAFPDMQWAGWEPVDERGLSIPLRPIVVTGAGDGRDRVFMATQQGVVYVFANDQQARESQVFLDLRKKVRYDDRENEEGFLGLAFHPRYERNGEFFAYYTTTDAPHVCVVSRFRVSKNDPNRADPKSEQELLRIPNPFWNHKGGTLTFGPDGYLYIALGDGGAANDPFGNGQNLKTLLGSILRIDVDKKAHGKNYAIPADNPFAKRKDARPEIYAYGFRNVWRMAFDRGTGLLWCSDVGQNLWEEIDLVTKGGNYGWNLREGAHPIGPRGSGPRTDLIEPIWEYDHQVGKCIIGGTVYRGEKVPKLEGKYLYADYVTGKIWALSYDDSTNRVVANHRIPSPMLPILSFGEDDAGEVYFTIVAAGGKGILRFKPEE